MIPTESVKAWEAGEKYLIEKIHRLQEQNAALLELLERIVARWDVDDLSLGIVVNDARAAIEKAKRK